MNQQIEIQRLSERGLTVWNATKKPFTAGGGLRKQLVEGKAGSNRFSLVERYDSGNDYEKSWRLFKEIGLPVVPTLRRGTKENIFLTDVKAKGGELYGKSLEYVLEYKKKRHRPRPEIDKIFLELMSSDKYEQVKARVEECVDIASENSIVLPQDDTFDLLIHPDGSWEVILLDLADGRWIFRANPVRNVREANMERAKIFQHELEAIENILQNN